MNDDPDFAIVRRCQAGDSADAEAAFRELVERYQDRVFNTAFRVVGNSADASDVAQEVFFTLFRKLGEFQFSSRLFTWIYRITVNLAIDKRRRSSTLPPMLGEGGKEGFSLGEIPDPERDRAETASDAEFIETRVHSAIQKLSPKLRSIVVLRYLEELSYEEIAVVLECSVGTVKSRLNRAHANLEQLLRPAIDTLAGGGAS
jgi:RNA polymerase sigma-70 factor (ECF subfamily)